MVDLQVDKRVIGLKWIYKTKYRVDGQIHKHKARLLVRGYTQQYGVDYVEVSSPIARLEIVRIFLALTAQANYKRK